MHVDPGSSLAPARWSGWLPAPSSRGRGRAHRLFHPLCGATPDTLLRLLLKGGVSPDRAHVAAIALAMTALRLPFALGEQTALAILRQLRPHDSQPAPVFVVGHWRSGTTHLSNLLSRSGTFGILSPMSVGLPAEALGLARLARPFIEQFFPRTRLIDEMPLRADLPQEDEMAMANLSTVSCNHGIYFPSRLQQEFDRGVFFDGVGEAELRRWARRLVCYVDKMSRVACGRPLLIRNPANSARITLLRMLWPDARFIHIHRHPADVCASSIRMIATLIRELSLGDTADADRQAAGLVRQVYPRLMQALHRDLAGLAPGRHVETSHEAILRAPLAEIERIHLTLGLAFDDTARRAVVDRLDAGGPHQPVRAEAGAPGLRWLDEHAAIFRRLDYPLPDDPDRATVPG